MLNSRSPLHPKWTTHNRPVDTGFFLSDIEIFNPKITDATYDAATNTWTGAREIVWTGKARIQQVNKVTNTAGTNPSSTERVEFHLDFDKNTLAGSNGVMPDIRPNFQIFVTSCPTDPIMEKMIFTIRGTSQSSLSWNRVLFCDMDQEARID